MPRSLLFYRNNRDGAGWLSTSSVRITSISTCVTTIAVFFQGHNNILFLLR